MMIQAASFFSQFFSDFFTQPLNNLWIKTNGYILHNHYIFNYLSIFYAFFFKYNQQPFFLCGSRAGRWWFKQPIWNNGMVSKHRFSHCLPQLAATDVFKVLFLSLRTSIFFIASTTVQWKDLFFWFENCKNQSTIFVSWYWEFIWDIPWIWKKVY